MRLTTVILMISMLQVSAATVAQEFNYVKKGASLIEIFKEIKKQTGYNIIWNEKKIDVTTTIDADFKKATIQHVLDKCLSNLSLSYSINDKMVMIKEKEPSFRDKVVSFFTAIDVRGRVVDENNVPLVGAVVKIKGGSISTPTNSNGEFLLGNVDENATLVISYLGYEKQEVKVSKNVGTVKLMPRTGKLEEVEINAGYYTVTDRERTGAISRVDAEDIGKQPINNPLMALVGRVAGLQVTQTTGVPGGQFNVRIRGQNSIASGNNPLYIVDGVNYPSAGIAGSSTNFATGTGGSVSPLSLINPNDIESVEVLKDADATAIYGSRGANGVIIITTKRGRQGNTKIETNFLYGISEVGHKLNLLNTEQYLLMRKEAIKNDGLQISATDYDVNGTWDQKRYTDWQEKIIGGAAKTTNASLNISGGAERSNYLIAGNYNSEGTVYPGDFDFIRTGVRSTINLGRSQDRFHANFTTNFNYIRSNLPGLANIVRAIYMPPNAPDLYNQYGQLNWADNTVVYNPMAALEVTSKSETDNMMGNLVLDYKILNNLILKTSFGYTSIKRQEFQRAPLTALNPGTNLLPTQRVSYFGNIYNNSLIAEPQITYTSKIGVGKIDVLLGMSVQDNTTKIGVVRASNFTSDDLMENIGSAGTIANDQSDFSQYRYLAVFGRVNYSLKDNIFVNLTARRDGSSRFGSDNQFANFGAIGAAWVFSDNKVIKEALPFLNFGKLRASYGLTGNDQIANYGYLDLWNTYNIYGGSSTLTPSLYAPNADFAWETNRKLEAAIQLGFLKERINLEVAYYRNRSSNQLLLQDLPLSSGKLYVYSNVPAEIQNQGLELNMDLSIISLASFKWSVNMNLSIPKNKLLFYPELEKSLNANVYKVGAPLNILNTYNVTVNKTTGLYSFEDKNKNSIQDEQDRFLTKSLDQIYYGGLQNSLRYKQFHLDFHFTFVSQNGRKFNAFTTPGRFLAGFGNQMTNVLSRWQEPGNETLTQKFSTTSTNNSLNSTANVLYGNISVVDASFIRLRNVSLGWSFPKKLLSALKINNASLSLQGQNLFTITNYVGLDPETQSTVLPPLRTIMMGINVTF